MADWDRRARPTKGSTRDELYYWVGRSLTDWERLEYRIFLIYLDTVSPNSVSPAALHAFGSVQTSSVRLEMTRQAIIAAPHLPETIRERAKALINRMSNFAARRNDIAHGTVGNVKIEGVDLSYLLRPAFYNMKRFSYDEGAAYLFGVDDLAYYDDQFVKLVAEAEMVLGELSLLPTPTNSQP
jgi:hypothetical protein